MIGLFCQAISSHTRIMDFTRRIATFIYDYSDDSISSKLQTERP